MLTEIMIQVYKNESSFVLTRLYLETFPTYLDYLDISTKD